MELSGMTHNNIINAIRYYYTYSSIEADNDFVISLLYSQSLSKEIMNWISQYIIKNIKLNDDEINMDLLNAYIYGIKKNKYDYYTLYDNLLTIYDILYKFILFKSNCYNTLTPLCCKSYRLLWFVVQSTTKVSILNNALNRMFSISLRLPNKLRLHCRDKILNIIVRLFNKQAFNKKHSVYINFTIMFPEKRNELDSRLLLNKLI